MSKKQKLVKNFVAQTKLKGRLPDLPFYFLEAPVAVSNFFKNKTLQRKAKRPFIRRTFEKST